MRKIALMSVLVAGLFTTSVSAQQPARDQYSPPPPVGGQGGNPGGGNPGGGNPGGGNPGGGNPGGGNPGGGNPGGGNPGGGNPGGGNPGGGNPGGSGGGSNPGGSGGGRKSGNGRPLAGSSLSPSATQTTANRVSFVQFGTAPANVRQDILIALRQAGLQILDKEAPKARIQDLLVSPLARLLSTKGDQAIGQAFGAQLVQVTPLARRAFPVLFGPDTPFVPVIRAVLARRDSLTDKQVAFQTGVTKGLASTDIPLAYVERSDRKTPSLVKQYRKLGVLTVNNIDTPTGKLRLGKIMLGLIKSQKAVQAIKVQPVSQLTGTGGDSPGAAPWAILALLGAGAMVFMTGTFRRRSRRSA